MAKLGWGTIKKKGRDTARFSKGRAGEAISEQASAFG